MPFHLSLYLLCATVWGSTWFAIKYQIDVASPTLGVFLRFALSSLVLLAFCILTQRPLHFSRRAHLLFAGQGLFMFCLNYIFTYIAETMTSSGMIALTFTAMIYFNMLGLWIFFKQSIQPKVIIGAILGLLGILLIFYNDLVQQQMSSQTALGFSIGLIGALCASLGNMFATRIHKMHVPILSANAYGMLYGCLFTGLLMLAQQESWTLNNPTGTFWFALIYLSIVGTVIAFAAYIRLVKDIGPERAAYTSIISTIIALIISSIYEHIPWTAPMFAGVVLCLLGNLFVLYRRSPQP